MPARSTAQWNVVMGCQHLIYLIDTSVLSPLIAFHTSFSIDFSCLCIVIFEITHLWLIAIKWYGFFSSQPFTWIWFLGIQSTMPGHDHTLRRLYPMEGLANTAMVFNWICPVKSNEQDPVDILARVFNEYFVAINELNTEEDFLNFGHAASLFSEEDWTQRKRHLKKMHL